MPATGSTGVVLVALGCNLAIAGAKFVAFTMTGSSAMLSAAIHSLVDTSSQTLLLHGLKRAKRPPDAQHPFGYAKELYFWSFIVGILLFSLGSGVAISEGIEKLHNPHPLANLHIAYIVLAIAIVLVGFSTSRALSEFNKRRDGLGLVTGLRSSTDPALFVIVLQDLAALAGLLVALAGLFAADRLGMPKADGVAAIVIGFILAGVAAFMSVEIRSVIVGDAAAPAVHHGLADLLAAEQGEGRPIQAINEIRSVHLGPEDVLVAASVEFKVDETAASVEATTARLERAIKSKYPEVRQLFIEAQNAGQHAEIAKLRSAHWATQAAEYHGQPEAERDPDYVPWYQRDRPPARGPAAAPATAAPAQEQAADQSRSEINTLAATADQAATSNVASTETTTVQPVNATVSGHAAAAPQAASQPAQHSASPQSRKEKKRKKKTN